MHLLTESNYEKEEKAEISFILLVNVTFTQLSITEVPVPQCNTLCDLEQ